MISLSFTALTSVYLHIPFCAARCRYCDFATEACGSDLSLPHAYAQSLTRLVREAADLGIIGQVRTAYIGGGTPSLLGNDRLADLVAALASLAAYDQFELSFEANPESVDEYLLGAAHGAGATRVSIGVQSLEPAALLALGRIHTAERARQAIRLAVQSGLLVSVDLMCGVPTATEAGLVLGIQEVIAAGVGHISCYPLMIEEGTELERLCERGIMPWPDDDSEARGMQLAAKTLTDSGFARYEVASYAKDDQLCKHNCVYWTGKPYLGLGSAAASMLDRATYEGLRVHIPGLPTAPASAQRFRLACTSSPREIIAAHSLSDLRFSVEMLAAREALAEDLMLGLRMTRGISAERIRRAQTVIPKALLECACTKAIERGLARSCSTGGLIPTEQGWLLGNELYGLFWDLAHDDE
ncbi:coproporphyrinogen III oxidase family protein [Collinsella sp. AGMB00827]|uniref:Heme chaperone HemW n=1 Tax=Collinsella ureilytica TaxID=2869515 RepID=A0ABS7MKS2_9ACTN|nr:coproporphyrinogen-III oxidase family protein [Collinsella urealyticum]MBY4797970.1 coproporphyrinogen III oxidase family protein [Collinsella urealyticum]